MPELLQWLMAPFMFIEMLGCARLVSRYFEKREYFSFRFYGSGFDCLVVVLWIEFIYSIVTGTYFAYEGVGNAGTIIFKIGYYLVIYLLTIICILISYKIPAVTAMVSTSVGYAIQHIAANNANLILMWIPAADGAAYYFWFMLIYISVRLITYGVIYVCLLKKNYANLEYTGNNHKKSLLSLLVVLLCIGLSRLVNDGLVENSVINEIAYSLYSSISCLLVIALQFNLFENDAMQSKVDVMAELLHQEKEYYKLSKENIDIINIKYHDLKHQINALRENYSEESLAEIEDAISFYGSTVKTGNDALDVVLTQKKLQCEAQKIQLTCMARGELLAFMDDLDIHSLFGNALANAIESVLKEEDLSKRQISLRVVNTMNMCSIHFENYFAGELELKDGLPQTQKDPAYHGFGMRSMQRIVDKYDGVLTVSQSENKFNLDILLPLP